MQIKYYDIKDIIPYKNNPRLNDKSIKLVAESIKDFGFKVPIIIDKDGEIVAGHTRYEASKYLGLNKVPVIVANDLTDEQVKAFRLADNKVSEMAYWDKDKLEEEIKNIKNINMELLGFISNEEEIDWDNINEITEDNYEEPEHRMFECPYCSHVDRADHYKKNKILDVSDVL